MRKRFFCLVFLVFLSLSVFGISGPSVSSSTHPDQSKWYRPANVSFEFEVENAFAYSCEFDSGPDTVPDTVPDLECNEGSASFSNKGDGEWYFHVIAKVGSQWTDASHYSVKIDRRPPLAAQNVRAEPDTGGLGVRLSWDAASDNESGIAGYKIYRGFLIGFSITDSSTVVVKDLAEGTSFVDADVTEGPYYHYKVQSVDHAGNLGGIGREVISRAGSSCDLVVEVNGVIGTNFDLNIESDDFVSAASLRVTLPGKDENVVFSNVSGKYFFSYSFGLGDVGQGSILVDFSGEDPEGDDCSVMETFYIDSVNPSVAWVFPLPNRVLSDVVELKASALDPGDGASGISSVEFFYDRNGLVKIGDGALSGADYVFDWNTLNAPNFRYNLVVKASDLAGNLDEAEVVTTVRNTAVESGQASLAIESAEQARAEALGLKDSLESLGVESSVFDSVFSLADGNLSSAKSAVEGGFNFERAISEAQSAKGLFEEAIGSVEVSEYDSVLFEFDDSLVEGVMKKNGVKKEFLPKAVSNFSLYNPSRELVFYRIVDGNNVFFRAKVELSFDSNQSNRVKIVEVVPTSLAPSPQSLLSSNASFGLLNSNFGSGLVLLFDADLNAGRAVSYVIDSDLSQANVSVFLGLPKDEFFVLPPLVFEESGSIPIDVVARPVDLFSGGGFFGLDFFSFALLVLGSVLAVSFLLAVVSLALIFFVVAKNMKKGL